MQPKLAVIIGGASSGKSALAERLVLGFGLSPVYLATAEAHDAEMSAKIETHRAARGPTWRTVEAPLDLPAALATTSAGEAVLLDCATLWLSNLMLRNEDTAAETDRLFRAIDAAPSPVVVVSNEVGQGIVPENPLARRFRVEQGGLNCRLANRANLVVAVFAGLPMVLKGERPAWL